MDHDFEIWWPLFPKRSGANPKAAARVVWDRLVKFKQLPPMETMIAQTKAFTAECIRTKIYGTSYVPHARTWLSQRRFEPDGPVQAPVVISTLDPAILPQGYEDAARALIKQIGNARYMAFFGKAKWSNGGDVIKITAASGFDRQTIEINYVEELERLTGKQVEVMV